jgi:hypothetical protein
VNRNITKNWKKRGRRKRSLSGGNPNPRRLLLERFGEGHIKRRDRKIKRRVERKKRLPHG